MLISFKIMDPNPTLPQNPDPVEGHLEAASIHHAKAEIHLKEGEYIKAAEHATLAQKYLDLANEHIRKYYHK